MNHSYYGVFNKYMTHAYVLGHWLLQHLSPFRVRVYQQQTFSDFALRSYICQIHQLSVVNIFVTKEMITQFEIVMCIYTHKKRPALHYIIWPKKCPDD